MKSTIFWDITPCSPSSANRRYIPEDGKGKAKLTL
jgi:hypothetical protein